MSSSATMLTSDIGCSISDTAGGYLRGRKWLKSPGKPTKKYSPKQKASAKDGVVRLIVLAVAPNREEAP